MTIPEELEQLRIRLQQTADENDKLQVLLELCALPSFWGDPTEYRLLEEARLLSEKLDRQDHLAESLFWMGNFFYNKANYKQAETYFQESLKQFIVAGNKKGELKSLYFMGDIAARFHDYEIAFQRAENILEVAGDEDKNIAQCYFYRISGKICLEQGKYEDATKNHMSAKLICESTNDIPGIALILNMIAATQIYQAHFDEALKNFQNVLVIFENIGDRLRIGGTLINLGATYYKIGNYKESLVYYNRARPIFEKIDDTRRLISVIINAGLIYEIQGDYVKALGEQFYALKLAQEINDKQDIALAYNNIGMIQDSQLKYEEALNYYSSALKIFCQTENRYMEASVLNNMGNIYFHQGNLAIAMDTYISAKKIREEIGDKDGIAQSFSGLGLIYEKQSNFAEALEHHTFALKIHQEIGDRQGIAYSLESIGIIQVKMGAIEESVIYLNQALLLARDINEKEIEIGSLRGLLDAFRKKEDYKSAIYYFDQLYETEKEVNNNKTQKQLTNLNFQHNMEQKEKDLEIEQLRNVELKKERDRSDGLLLNILPAEVAEELKNKGAADAKLFDDVTVLYTDFKSFTKVTERLTPQQLVDELHICFSAFDEIMGKYNIEKIKTVGDAYMAVSGLPLAAPNHAGDVVNASIEIRKFISERVKLKGDGTFDIRIGVHSGSVVAGIVGIKKFAYDIWGDTVNTAARMEQNSEAGKINISETTYQLVKENFNCTYRGEIEAKNKGKMKMYFVN